MEADLSAESVIATASVVVALASLSLAYKTQRRAEQVALVQTHIALRTRFLEIYQHLPLAEDRDEGKAALQAYWHNAYDEWFITNKLTPRFEGLWSSFYRQAVASGLAHPVLEGELRRLLSRPEGFALYSGDFVNELETVVGRPLRGDSVGHAP